MRRARLLLLISSLVTPFAVSTAVAQDPIRTADINARSLTSRDFPRITRLAERVYGYEQIDPTKRIVTVNNLIIVTSEGVVVADGQGTVENTKRLVADIATLTPLPIKYVVVGSEHGDHTGGNSAFPSSAVFLASPFSHDNLARQAATPGRSVDAPRVVVPGEVVGSDRTLNVGDTEIRIMNIGRAHTSGDLVVFLPRERILWMSEVFSNRIFPSMANSQPSEWVQTLRNAERMNARIYVPAHGFIDSPRILGEELINFRLALEKVIAEGRRLHDAQVPVEQAVAKADFGPYARWTRRMENADGALRRVYMELDGQLK
jgi:glyoxylase-like metal-dependent hydrolase (beta-lactamase superfamily II)